MKITIITAVSLILAGATGTALQAQTIRPAAEPAEYPPANYRDRQYVDSKGCVFIKAGLDGNVTWVPRVNRARQQLCDATPSNVAGASRVDPNAVAPDVITLGPEFLPSAEGEPVEAAAPLPAPVKPQRTPASTSMAASEAALVPVRPSPIAPQPQRARPVAAPVAAPQELVTASEICAAGGCGQGLALTPNTRILPAHLYQERLQSADLRVPAGYKPAWEDGRLDQHRAEQTIQLTVIAAQPTVPAGYILSDGDDGRLNQMRGVGTLAGEAQMARIWTNTVPRKLVVQPENIQRFGLIEARSPYSYEVLTARGQGSQISTRSAPEAELPRATQPQPERYVRAATYADAAEARAVAQQLAGATGLDFMLGTVTRNGTAYKVVLAGPFTHGADKALQRVRAAGFSGARLSK